MTNMISVTKARKELPKLVENVRKNHGKYVITINDTPAAALISVIEYQSWKETKS